MSNAVLPPRRIVAVLLLACGFAAAAAVPAQARYDAPRTSLSVTLTQKPTANSHNTNAVFRWRRVGVARQTTCRLDTRAFGKCKGSSVTYRHLAEGVHRFSLKVRGRTATRTISSTWRVDVTTPDVPTSVTGGSVAWGTASRTLTAAGSTDSGSGLRGYQFRLSKDGGLTWSPPRLNNPIVVNTAGESVVQFRAMDKALNTSAWTLVPPTGEATVRIDRTVPSAPLPHGPTAGWQNVASLDVTADGSVDAGGSGLGGYSYRVSTDGGLSWLPEADGGALTVGTEGLTLVKFRAHDGAGNVSPWTQATVRIDRTAPSDPVVVGGSPAWLGIASVLVSASGSTDAPGSGVAGYERQTSTDGGATWSPSALGGALTVAAEGETLVRFRAVDVSGLPSGWVQTTVRLDRTAPAVPAVSGGGSGWQNVASIGLSAAGSTDTGGSGLSGYQFATSADGGATWSAPQSGASSTVSAEGQTLVRFRAFDNVGNGSPWATGTARIDRSVPTDPVVSGGSASWLSVASVDVSAAGSTDAGSGIALYLLSSSTNGGATWSPPAVGATLNVPAQGQTLVRFRAVDALGLTSNWVQATVRIDRTAPTSPVVSGGSLSWLGAAASTVTGAGSTDSGGSGLAGYEHRVSTDGGMTFSAPLAGASALISAEGQTLVQVRAVDAAGNASLWTPSTSTAGSTVRLDRTDPTVPSTSGGGPAWTNATSVAVSASGAGDAGSGIARYEYQTSPNAGATWLPATPSAGSTVSISTAGDNLVRFHAVDGVGRLSPWTLVQVRIDRTLPTSPTVTGGSLTWTSALSPAVSAASSTDAGGSGLAGYQYRTSSNNGSTWSAAVAGASALITVEGRTLVQFRSVDGAGNTSAWRPSSNGAANTVRLDRTAPSVPNVTGGSAATNCSRRRTIRGSGSTDGVGSGVKRYEYRTSSDNGVTWGAVASGTRVTLRTPGIWLVQFRAVDGVALASAWGPAVNSSTNTACIQ